MNTRFGKLECKVGVAWGVEGGDVSVMQAVWRHLRGGKGATLSLLMGGGGPTDESFSYSMEGGVDDHGGGGGEHRGWGPPHNDLIDLIFLGDSKEWAALAASCPPPPPTGWYCLFGKKTFADFPAHLLNSGGILLGPL